MPSFLYYRPHQVNPVTLADVKAWGLGYAFSTDPAPRLCMGNTPDGNNGTVFHDQTRAGDSPLAMDLDNQTWAVCADTGCWVGYWNDQRPTPIDLARPQQLRGYDVLLGDGNEWKVPLVRRFNQQANLLDNALPSSVICGADGKWTKGQMLAAHAEMWDVTQPLADDYISQILEGGTPTEFTDQILGDAATMLLQKNYVVGAGELSILGTFNTEIGVQPVFLAACDAVTMLRWMAQKKTEQMPDGVSTSDGETA